MDYFAMEELLYKFKQPKSTDFSVSSKIEIWSIK